jgi:PPOX class probable F420-dependent enzyme
VLSTLRPDGTIHAVPVGFTFDPETRLVRVIASRQTRKVHNVLAGSPAVICQVEGRRWLTLEGSAWVREEPQAVALAVERYARRYRPPRPNPARVALEIAVERVMGWIGFELPGFTRNPEGQT